MKTCVGAAQMHEGVLPLFPIFVPRGKNKTRGKVGYIDRSGKLLIDAAFDDGTGFHGGLAAVKVKTKWGFIDREGRLAIEPQFTKPGYFEGGVASVCTSRGHGVIDTAGSFLHSPEFPELLAFSEGMSRFSHRDQDGRTRYGYLDRFGKIVIPAIFCGALSFSEGLAAVNEDGLWGYIKTSGAFQIRPSLESYRDSRGRLLFAGGSYFHEGLAPLRVRDGVAFIDKTGSPAFTVDYELAQPFSEGKSIVRRNEMYGFIDSKGRTAVEPRFSFCLPFSGGWAPVEIKDSVRGKLWGFIDAEANWIVEPKFLSSLDVNDGLCLVETEKCLAYVNRNGEFVWEGPFVEYRRFGL